MKDSGKQSVLRNMSIVSIGTLLSRISGFFRDQLMAIIFGASGSIVPDAYYAAFKFPNSMRNLMAEGGMTAAFLPTFKDYLLKDRRDAKNVSNIVFTYLSIFLIILTFLGIVFSPQIIYITASGFAKNREKFELAVLLLRILFPYLYLISITALATAILNSLYHFAIPSITPVLLNLSIITGAVLISRFTSKPILGVAIGILIGGILQVGIQLPLLIKHKYMFRPCFNFKHPALKKIILLMIPTLFTFSVYEITAIIEQQIASHLEQGTISVLYFGNRIFQLPLGIFAIALSSALLPVLAESASNNNFEKMKYHINMGIKTILTLSLPSAIFLFLLSDEIFEVLFQYGNFSGRDSARCAAALKAYSLGLVFISFSRIFAQVFYALKNTRTPALSSFITLLFFSVAAPVFTFLTPLGFVGLPLATALSGAVNFSTLLMFLNKRVGKIINMFSDKNTQKILGMSAILFGVLFSLRFLKDPAHIPSLIFLIICACLTLAMIFASYRIIKISRQ